LRLSGSRLCAYTAKKEAALSALPLSGRRARAKEKGPGKGLTGAEVVSSWNVKATRDRSRANANLHQLATAAVMRITSRRFVCR
jgi:hypothetical protein